LKTTPRLLLLSLLAALTLAVPARAGLFLSELCDPTNNYVTDRFIEIYNPGPGSVDLTGWSVVAIANSVDVTTWTLSGTIAPDQALVCGNNTTVAVFTVNFPNAQWGASGYFNWNGKIGDGAKLVAPGNVIVDQVVAPGTLFENSDMVRVSSVTAGSPSYVVAEWTVTPVTLATDGSPGTHNGSAPPPVGPVITNVATDPAVPPADTDVYVQADVSDTLAPVTAVTLYWGNSAGSTPNAIDMPLLSGSTYRSVSPIPGQPAGSGVYWKVQADDGTLTATTAVFSYVIGGGTPGAPTILSAGQTSDSTAMVIFSEAVEATSASTPGNYAIGTNVAVAASLDPLHPSQVTLTFHGLTPGAKTLTANGVADLTAVVEYGQTVNFNWIDVSIPAGYYDSAIGLKGMALRSALHQIIRNHTVQTYAYALTAFATTDVKPNGKIWDVYSDVPGGTPAYEYSVGQTGSGGSEGLGYNREHSFPQSWFGGASPMYSDLWILYPTDSYVNNRRSNYAYGVVGSASWTSTNGTKLGTSASAGYSGTVFEPIDAYKGDLARSTFYVATRYFGEDAGWPGGPESSGAELYPWAAAQYLTWSNGDAPSWKERLRNGAIWAIQHNRNPFVDHPEFATAIWDSTSVTTAVGGHDLLTSLRLRPAAPNPFVTSTSFAYELARSGPVTLGVFDVTGRRVRALASGATQAAGTHSLAWDGRDDAGAPVAAGLYFVRLEAGAERASRRVVYTR
jgi:endonuclease I